jgi:hypothetical protein
MYKMDQVIEVDGEQWRILGIGVTREDGATYLHLASLTRGTKQRNGFCPAQICVWL